MRVLMTTDTVGGVWTFTLELAAGLLQQGCEVALYSVGGPLLAEQSNWVRDMDRRWGSRFCFASSDHPLEWMQENGDAYSQAAPSLLRLAEELQPDVFHCNQFCFGALPVSSPKVLTAHSDVLSWADGCGENSLEPSAWLDQYLSLVRGGLNGADTLVAPTRWMLKTVGQNFKLPAMRCVIPNGRKMDVPTGRGRELQAVTAGRLWDAAKNVAMLADVSSPMPILVAGETSWDGAGTPTLVGHARLLGALSQETLAGLFTGSAIYICTSSYEPFGLAPLEAALCGCAVLTNDIPSLREVWGDGALYFRGADTLSRLLQELHTDKNLLRKAQARSLKQARKYTREAMTLAYLSIYREAAARKGTLTDVA